VPHVSDMRTRQQEVRKQSYSCSIFLALALITLKAELTSQMASTWCKR